MPENSRTIWRNQRAARAAISFWHAGRTIGLLVTECTANSGQHSSTRADAERGLPRGIGEGHKHHRGREAPSCHRGVPRRASTHTRHGAVLGQQDFGPNGRAFDGQFSGLSPSMNRSEIENAVAHPIIFADRCAADSAASHKFSCPACLLVVSRIWWKFSCDVLRAWGFRLDQAARSSAIGSIG